MASDAGNFWEYIGRFRTFPYFHSIIFVVNYKMNIISSHKMYIISPSVTRAAVRGWFLVSGCSSDMSGCIHWNWYWYPGDCIRSLGQLRHRFATYYGSRISQKSGSDLGSRVFEAPFASLVFKYSKADTCLQWSLEPLSMGTVKSCEVLLTALVNCSLLHWLPWPHHCWSWTRNKWSMCWSCPQKTFYTVLVIHAHYLFIYSLQFMGKF